MRLWLIACSFLIDSWHVFFLDSHPLIMCMRVHALEYAWTLFPPVSTHCTPLKNRLDTATHCTLQYTASHCKTLQQITTLSICSNLLDLRSRLLFLVCVFVCMYVCVLGLRLLRKSFFCPPNQALEPSRHHSSCVLIIHLCLCVYASICTWENMNSGFKSKY